MFTFNGHHYNLIKFLVFLKFEIIKKKKSTDNMFTFNIYWMMENIRIELKDNLK